MSWFGNLQGVGEVTDEELREHHKIVMQNSMRGDLVSILFTAGFGIVIIAALTKAVRGGKW